MTKFKGQMNVKVQKGILKRVQNDILVMPNQVLSLIQDLRISASHLSFGFDLTFELWNLAFSLPRGLKVDYENLLHETAAGISWATEDAKEGTKALLEKRKPHFKDR